jgi:hypothetical protein
MVGACNALLMWNKVGGKEVPGFTRWRQAERVCLVKVRYCELRIQWTQALLSPGRVISQ